MNYNIISEIIGKELRYISLGWTRIYPFHDLIESHSLENSSSESSLSSIYLEFGDALDIVLKVSCECVAINNSDLYRLNVEKINEKSHIPKTYSSISIGETITEIILYVTNENIDSHPEDILENRINAAMIKFTDERYLILYGKEGDDQFEPCIQLDFKTYDKMKSYFFEWIDSKWKKVNIFNTKS